MLGGVGAAGLAEAAVGNEKSREKEAKRRLGRLEAGEDMKGVKELGDREAGGFFGEA